MIQWLADNWYYIVIGVAVVVAVIVVVEYLIARRLTSRLLKPRKITKEQAIMRLQNDFGVDYSAYNDYTKEMFTYISDGVAIKGEFIYNDVPTKRWVILSHGYTSCRLELIRYVYLYYNLGYNCMIYDQRYFGHSQGEFCTLGYFECKDLLNLINYLYQRQGQDITVGLHGESMGAACVLSALEYTDRVQFAVADCAFSDTNRLYKQLLRKILHVPVGLISMFCQIITKSICGYTFDKVSPIRAVAKSNVPILFFHGTQDRLIDCSHSVQMFDICNNPISRIVLVPEADHACSLHVDPYGYNKALTMFLDSVVEQENECLVKAEQGDSQALIDDNCMIDQQAREQEEMLRSVKAQIQRQMNSVKASTDDQYQDDEK
ncbi:MAG: alpha/beta hydrolase [Clostridia bacterium]|nr:alpha/beta hydrolase [Clostridia bacterium]